ncbi:MAG: tyrosine-type recombinase/integrase, partial [Ekhidna sp.]
MADTKYLKKQKTAGGTFLFQMYVPEKWRHLNGGKSVLSVSTGTNDLRKAQFERNRLLKQWHDRIEEKTKPDVAKLRKRTKELEDSLKEILTEEDFSDWHLRHNVEDAIDDNNLLEADAIVGALGGTERVSGLDPEWTLQEIAEKFRAHREKHVSDSYVAKITRATRRWCEFIEKDGNLNSLRRVKVVEFIDHLQSQLKPKTVKDTVSLLNKIWAFGYDREYVQTISPFDRHTYAKQETEHYKALTKKEWKDTVHIWKETCIRKGKSRGAELFPFLVLSSGMRIEEMAGLRKKDIVSSSDILCYNLHNEDRTLKNKASVRLVPVASRYLSEVKKLATGDPAHFLFEEAENNATRSEWLSRTFSESKNKLGIYDRTKSMHSLRKMFATAGENAGVEEVYVSSLLGHTNSTTTSFRIYSDGYH